MSGGKGTLWMVVIFLLVVGGGFLAVNWNEVQERGHRFIETGNPLSLLQEKDSGEREGTTHDGVYRKKISEGLLKENGAFRGKGPQGAGAPRDGDLYGALKRKSFFSATIWITSPTWNPIVWKAAFTIPFSGRSPCFPGIRPSYPGRRGMYTS